LDKYKKGEFGKCPRVNCNATHLLPTGLSDVPGVQFVKLYCPRCEDIYNPKSSRHASIDGAYFGTSFANILFQVYPALVPEKIIARYEPKVFGFRVHAAAALQRWQENHRDQMLDRLKIQGIENVFGDDEELESEGDNEEGMDIGGDL
jgi:casein kinase II subunit beta